LIFKNTQGGYLFQAMASDLACSNVAKIPYFVDNLTHVFTFRVLGRLDNYYTKETGLLRVCQRYKVPALIEPKQY
jgi:hypothetical protein